MLLVDPPDLAREIAGLGGLGGRLAEAAAGGAALTFLDGTVGGRRTLPYADLLKQALETLAGLQAAGVPRGAPVLVQIDDNEGLLTAIWACILGGLLPAPVHVGSAPEHLRKVLHVWHDLGRPWIATDTRRLAVLARHWRAAGEDAAALERRAWCRDARVMVLGPAVPVAAAPDDPALLQYSSGSTGTPKGVLLTHRNILTDTAGIVARCAMGAHDRILSWVPLTHDLGLIGVTMTAALHGIPCALMPTQTFIRRPLLWLEAAADLGATLLYGTNFALDYVLEAAAARLPTTADLSAVRCLILGAEPISATSCRRFTDRLAPLGLRAEALMACYGLAEGTIAVTVPRPGGGIRARRLDPAGLAVGRPVAEAAPGGRAVELVECGTAIDGCRVTILDDAGRALPERHLGHIAIAGPTVSPGYWGRDRTAAPDGRVITGDLGFLDGGALVVTGRSDDVIILDGLNIYPQDLERVAQEQAGVEPGCVVACGVAPAGGGPQRIALFLRSRHGDDAFAARARQVAHVVTAETGLPVAHVVRIRKVPRTTSGKPQRFALVRDFLDGRLSDALAAVEAGQGAAGTLAAVRAEAEAVCGPLDPDRDLTEQGVSSLVAVEVAGRIGRRLGVPLPLGTALGLRTLRAIADHLDAREPAPSVLPASWVPLVDGATAAAAAADAPLVLVHPGSGAVTPYLPLARALADTLPVVGLQAPGVRPGEAVLTSIPALAAHHVAALRATRPASPYRLGGWSFGGLVALEMARLLRQAGAVVAPVVLLDTGCPGRRVPTGGLPTDPQAVDDAVVAGLLDKVLGVEAAGGSLEERLAAARARGLLQSIFAAAVDAAAAVRLVRCYSGALAAATAWRQRPCDGPVALIRAADGPAGRDPSLGWGRLARHGLHLLWSPGDHETLVAEENAPALAAAVRQALGVTP